MKIEAAETVLDLPLKALRQEGNVRAITDDDVRDLAASIQEKGLLEPVVVRELKDGEYGLVFGFRRARAAKLAGLLTLPAIVRKYDDTEVREAQLVENIQREDLNPVDEARAMRAYLDLPGDGRDGKRTQTALAKAIGKGQPYVANRLRLLGLPDEATQAIANGKLSSTHGEVLLKIPAEAVHLRREMAQEAVKNRVSVDRLTAEVDWRVREFDRTQKLAKDLGKFKFPKCPTCDRLAQSLPYSGDELHCSEYDHGAWHGKTGEAVETVRPRVSSNGKPLPPKDRKEGPTVRVPQDAYSIAQAILAAFPRDKLRFVMYRNRYTQGAELTVTIEGKAPIEAVEFTARPHEYASGERTELSVFAFDSKHRKDAKAAWAKWASKALPKVAAPKGKKAEPVDPKLLAGTVDEITGRLGKLPPRTTDWLAIREAEEAGESRAGVLDYLDLRLSPHERGGD